MLRQARIASFGTIDHGTGGPFVSLVNVATDFYGFPVLLLSRLAWHTRNIGDDRRVSLLVADLPRTGDALTGARVSVLGNFAEIDKAAASPRYLAHHPEAAMYVDFSDFAFWRIDAQSVHCVAGFGRIETFAADDVFLCSGEYTDLAVQAPQMMGAENAGQGIMAIDPDGANMMAGGIIKRVNFAAPVKTVAEWWNRWAQIDETTS
ncbi:pyridoxamine 5'-phosphate oxidase family protein [soil metagenome]